jgi:hypothetical protein
MIDLIQWTKPAWPQKVALPLAGGLTVVALIGLLTLG